MSNSLRLLIKIAKHEVEVMRQELAQKNHNRAVLLELIEKLKQELLQEQEIARSDIHALQYYPLYAEKNVARQKGIEVEVKKLDESIEQLMIVLQDKFAELKKYELVEQKHEQQAVLQENKEEEQTLDELSIGRYNRE
jgi:flagellar biosynthesis chaperone FliJ